MKRSLAILFSLFLTGQLCSAQGIITTVAGNGTGGYSGDGMPATSASMQSPDKLFVDAAQNIYIADGVYNNVIRKVNAATGIITTIAGTGTAGTTGDGGPATAAKLNGPSGVYVNAAGDVFITEAFGNVIRKIDAGTGIIHTVAGSGLGAYFGDGGPATSAGLNVPNAITGDTAGNLYFTEYGSSTVRKITASTDIISTIAGTGLPGTSTDGVPAITVPLKHPDGLCVDKMGNVYVVDAQTHRIRKITAATGIISTVAGNNTYGYSGDGGPATMAKLFNPWDVHLDAAGNLYIADASNNAIRKVNTAGIISTIAGNGTSGYSGDGGNSLDALLYGPSGISVTASGIIYVVDGGNNVVRKIAAPTAVNTVAQQALINVFPNPAKDELHITGIQTPATYRITDMTGREMQTGTLATSNSPIFIANLPNGIYILELNDQQGGRTILPIVKEL